MFLEENGLLDETQASFRKHYSTTDQIYLFHSLIGLIMKRRNIKKLFCAFIDLIAVFDSVLVARGLAKTLMLCNVNNSMYVHTPR